MDADTVIATAAVVIALVALCVSVWSGFQNRKHNRLSVRPRLRLDRFTYTDRPVQIIVKNNGTGLAIIRSFVVKLDNKEVSSDSDPPAAAAVMSLGVQEKLGDIESYTLSLNDTLAAGEQITLIAMPNFPNNTEARSKLRNALSRIDFIIKYESIYGETFVKSGY